MAVHARFHLHRQDPLYAFLLTHVAVTRAAGSISMGRVAEQNEIRKLVDELLRREAFFGLSGEQRLNRRAVRPHGFVTAQANANRRETGALLFLRAGMA